MTKIVKKNLLTIFLLALLFILVGCTEFIEPKICNNGIKDGDESDVDCGGSKCDPCKASMHCQTDKDCEYRICAENSCIEPPPGFIG